MKILVLLGCIALSLSSFGQKTKLPHPPSTPKNKSAKSNFTGYSLQKRLGFYPFNQSTQIMLVSFPARIDSIGGRRIDGVDKDRIEIYGLPRLHDTISFSQLTQERRLTLKEIDTLTDILYNTCSRLPVWISESSGCWKPRNAIIFFDELGKPFEYFEICFQCNIIENSRDNIPNTDFCPEAFDDLQKFFEKTGMKTKAEDFKTPN